MFILDMNPVFCSFYPEVPAARPRPPFLSHPSGVRGHTREQLEVVRRESAKHRARGARESVLRGKVSEDQ